MQNKQMRDAVIFTLLSIFYPVYLFLTKNPESVSTTSLVLATFLPIVGIIFSLNVTNVKYKWGLSFVNLLIFILFLYYLIVLR
ncbi:Hypothetical protein Tpal_72 [Trichococcus palustris]|jgi:hypothetical protein|uniref:Uncharacterized protein n=1 Tax=Trichococcus palustris TaxID=140314 RepID=A0A143Y667_9LACT|nr:hypothetical protein [Trichococcus palustris]CZQ80399.1 Hypothetical protein Tpal_72 [Trichococcus palustris]SFK64642.1 hypothetical protein SAMN04488076_102220 [Trichococcus palustris]